MTIRDYIQKEVFQDRAREHGCLVIYDPARRYRDLARGLDGGACRVLDASESVIEQRELASVALKDLAEGRIHQLIVWVPAVRPQDDEVRQKDPFGVFGVIGAEFPSGDGDLYDSLCRRAKPDHVPEINRLFEEGEPTFDTIDALDQGGSWPKLKTLLAVTSAKEIVLAILAPKPEQDEALKTDPTWVSEAREFIQRSLGHKLKTKGQTRSSIAEELWRVILFSEFVFDSKGDIPAALETVSRCGKEARDLVFDICDELRKHEDYKDAYLITAQEVERELSLANRSEGMESLGERDTFSFEERHFLNRLVNDALDGRLDEARAIWQSRRRTIRLSHEDRLAEWSLAARALDLLDSESPHQVLQVIPALVRQIIRGVSKVADLGFQKAVIATDHGFILVHEQAAGNVAQKPAGQWLIEKARCLLGQGQADATNVLLKRADMGIPGDFEDFAAPKALVPYSRGQIYYHEGLSLQECVLPCLTVDLKATAKTARPSAPRLTLTYRQGRSDKITTRRPVVDLSWPDVSLFADESEIEVTVEASDSKGNIVGWVGSGQSVNPATGGVRICPGQAISIGLRMEDAFAGQFTVKVLDPATNALIAQLPLKTAYLE